MVLLRCCKFNVARIDQNVKHQHQVSRKGSRRLTDASTLGRAPQGGRISETDQISTSGGRLGGAERRTLFVISAEGSVDHID